MNDVKYDTPELPGCGRMGEQKTVFQPRFTILNGDNQKAVTNSIQAVLSGTSPEEAAQQAQAIIDQHIGK